MKTRYVEWLLVFGLIAVGLGLRLVNLTDQPLDFHATRQLRSAIIARGMYYQTLPNLDPSVRQAAQVAWDSMERYEPPVLETLVAFSYRLAGGEYLWLSRLFSISFWLIGGTALYLLVRRLVSAWAGLFSLAFYLILPWGVVASRAFQPDPFMVMWILLAALALEHWMESQGRSWLWAVLAGLFSSLAVYIKAVAFFPIVGMMAGVFLALLFDGRSMRWSVLRRPQLWLVILLAGSLPAVYYLGLGQRSSEFASFWIFSYISMIFESKFYVRWLGLIRGLMDVMVFFAAVLGVFLFSKKGRAVVMGLWAGYFLLGFTFPFQIVTHDYYSLLLVPIAAVSLAPYAELIRQKVFAQPFFWRAAFGLAALAVVGYYGYVARSVLLASNFRLEPVPWREMGTDLPRDGHFIALTQDYGNRLKYYSLRMPARLWPTGGDIDLAAEAGTEKIADFQSFLKTRSREWIISW